MSILFAVPVLYYYVLTVFVFTQQRHIKNFQGTSRAAESALLCTVALGSLAKLVFLVLYGIRVKWWAPFAIAGIDLAAGGLLQLLVSMIIPEWILSLLGFIGIPVLGFLMFYSL